MGIILFWGLYCGPLNLGNYQVSVQLSSHESMVLVQGVGFRLQGSGFAGSTLKALSKQFV